MKQIVLTISTLWFASSVHAAIDSTQLVSSARAQIGVTKSYDSAYRKLEYPNGDVPMESGVCCDVVIRALRKQGVDLQRLVHEDMKASFASYPKNWGLSKTDANIDHRRVPNLACFFQRRGWTLPVTRDSADYRPGDLVTWTVARTLPHIGIVSDRRAPAGTPLIIHNIGQGAKEEDVLFSFPITGHYRTK